MQSYKKSAFFVIFLAIIVLAGFSLFPSKTLADYNTAGFVVSNNLLPAQGASIINSFAYNATAIPAGTQLKARFSKDGVDWYNSSGSYAAWNILSAGTNTIDLSPLGWRTVNFYYELFFVSNGSATPVLKSITLNFIDSVSVTSNYYASGALTSTNLLSGQSVSSINSFTYNAIDIPSGTGLSVQFSQDNSNWYNSSGVQNGSDTLSTGNNTIDLSGLGWTSANLYYKISLTSNGTDTPVLKSASLNFRHLQFNCGSVLVDSRNSHTYATVQIGSQCWMAQNLNVGTEISGSTAQANNSTIEKYCYNDVAGNCATYGGLYQWGEAMQYASSCDGVGASPSDGCASPVHGICPDGWHIPSHYEFVTLENAVCTSATCSADFPYSETAVGNFGANESANLQSGGSSGFNASLPGYYQNSNSYNYFGGYSGFWSSSVSDGDAWSLYLGLGISRPGNYLYTKSNGFPVRCVGD